MKTGKTRRVIFWGVLAAGLTVAGMWLYAWLHPEPSYQGKAMSKWFKETCRSGQFMQGSFDWEHHRECVEAFKAMGTNAVPFLVEQSFDFRQDSRAWSNTVRFLNSLPASWPVPRPLPSWAKTEEAADLVREMEPPAGQLLFLLRKHLNATNLHEHRQVLYILGTSGEGSAQVVPYLTAALKETDNWTRGLAIQSLGWIGPQAKAAVPDLIAVLHEQSNGTNYLGRNAAVALGRIGSPTAASAVPVVKELFEREQNWNQRGNLGVALMRIDPTQTEVLDFLIEGVTNHQPVSQRWVAANYLGRIGPAARPAVPILIKALDQTNDTLFAEIPQALTNIGVAPGEFLPAMKMRLKRGDRTAQSQTAMQVVRIAPGDHDALEVLTNVISTGELGPGWELVVIESLGDAGPRAAEALPLLRKVANESTDERTREKALQAIKKIEGPPK